MSEKKTYKITINDPRPDHKIPVADIVVSMGTMIEDIVWWRNCMVKENPEDYPILVEVIR